MRDIVYLVGRGKLATSIFEELTSVAQRYDVEIAEVIHWDERPDEITDHSRIALVHVGSGRQFSEATAFCRQHQIPFIQGVTGVTYPDSLLHDIPFVFIDAPNLSIPIIKFLYLMEKMGPLFQEYDISICESHQQSKTSPPGTAYEIANYLGVDTDSVRSVRDPNIQQEQLGIPAQYLEQHAFHQVEIAAEDCTLSFHTEIHGLRPYLVGIAKILQNIDRLSSGFYTLPDLIRKQVL